MEAARDQERTDAPVAAPSASAAVAVPLPALGNGLSPSRIVALQRTAGNASVTNLLRGRRPAPPTPPLARLATPPASGPSILDDIAAASRPPAAPTPEGPGEDTPDTRAAPAGAEAHATPPAPDV